MIEDELKEYVGKAIEDALKGKSVCHSYHPREVFSDDLLDVLILETETTLDILRNTRERKGSMAKNCHDAGVNYKNFRRRVTKTSEYNYERSLEYIEEQITKEERLLMEIIEVDDPCSVYDFIQNADDYIDFALNQLPERISKMIYAYYFDEKSYAKIGDEYGLSSERVRQIIRKGIRMLRHPDRKPILIWGREERLKYTLFCNQFESDDEDINPYDITSGIEVLELSVRSYNCLKRAGIHTIKDLMLFDESELIKIRNLGKISLEEILDKRSEIIPPMKGEE